jgi:hypothetical protein
MPDYGEIFAAAVPVALATLLQIATHPAMIPVWLVIGGGAVLTAMRAFVHRRRGRRAW